MLSFRLRGLLSLSELTGERAGTDPDAWRQALGRRTELFGERAQPKRSWWQRLRRRRPPKTGPPEATPAAATQPGSRRRDRPWWDWFGLTGKKK